MLSNLISRFENEKQKLLDEIKEIKQSEEYTTILQKIHSIKSEDEKIKDMIKKLESELKDITQVKETATKIHKRIINNLKSEITNITEKRSIYYNQIIDIKSQKKMSEIEIEVSHIEIELIVDKIKELDQQINEKELRLAEAEQEFNEVEKQNAEIREKNIASKQQKEKLYHMIDVLKTKLSKILLEKKKIISQRNGFEAIKTIPLEYKVEEIQNCIDDLNNLFEFIVYNDDIDIDIHEKVYNHYLAKYTDSKFNDDNNIENNIFTSKFNDLDIKLQNRLIHGYAVMIKFFYLFLTKIKPQFNNIKKLTNDGILDQIIHIFERFNPNNDYVTENEYEFVYVLLEKLNNYDEKSRNNDINIRYLILNNPYINNYHDSLNFNIESENIIIYDHYYIDSVLFINFNYDECYDWQVINEIIDIPFASGWIISS